MVIFEWKSNAFAYIQFAFKELRHKLTRAFPAMIPCQRSPLRNVGTLLDADLRKSTPPSGVPLIYSPSILGDLRVPVSGTWR
jgi:hypothetical protein